MDTQLIFEFRNRAMAAGYAGNGTYEKIPERSGFKELTYSEGNWFYRDSYCGWFQSRGMEVVRYNQTPIWAATYGGGVVKKDRELTRKIFKFLKQALAVDNKGFASFRGPLNMKIGKWEYQYIQEGDIEEFKGTEKILYQNQSVFYHQIIGGVIVS